MIFHGEEIFIEIKLRNLPTYVFKRYVFKMSFVIKL